MLGDVSFQIFLINGGPGIHDLDKRILESAVLMADQLQMIGQDLFLPLQPDQFIVGGAGHTRVNIVIPGNKALMADRSQKGPADQIEF